MTGDLYKNVLRSITDMRQKLDTPQMSSNKRMNVLLCILTMEYYISMKTNRRQLPVTTWTHSYNNG